ncbi:MAG: ABC transporter ATP-binding protein [Candidatus Altiarchaeota archaeon]
MDTDLSPEPDTEYGTRDLLRDLWGYIRPYRTRFLLSACLRFLGDLAGLYPPWALGAMTTFFVTYKSGEHMTYFWTLMAFWLVLGLFRFTSREVCKYHGYQVAEKTAIDAEVQAIRHLFRLDIRWHESEYAGSKIRRMKNGSDGIRNLIFIFYNNIIESTVSIVAVFLIILALDVEMSIILAFFIVTYYALSYSMSKRASLQARIVRKREEGADGVGFEAVSNIMTVKTLGIGDIVLGRINASMDALFAEIKKRIYLFRTREAILGNYATLFRVALMAYIGYGIYQGRFEVGVLIMVYTYFDRIWAATAEMSVVTDQILVYRVSLGRLRMMMDVKPTIEVEGKQRMPDWGKIEVSNVSFAYGQGKVLQNISFTVKKGERIGLVGPSGSGKTTLFRLLLKLHEDYDGSITIDDIPLREIDRRAYIERIAVVLQDTEVFNMTLKENIEVTGGTGGLNEALRVANLEEILPRLTEGIDTVIGEKGVKLSGGERQRLGIARAVYKRPDILFLDEATSHLDSESEERISDSLRKVFKEVTAVVIAHRLSTIREMDRILVLQEGKLVEEGTFEGLCAKNGLFCSLWQKQKL